ncbi:hypothetical protein [Burkholderia phage BCSR5]|nr:hypothetical protein [Burkholderia phage BCSR5]
MTNTSELLTAELDMNPALFYPVGRGFVLLSEPVPQGSSIQIGSQLPLRCMFETFDVLTPVEGVKIGYYMQSQFQVENGGSYLLCYMNKGRGKADKAEVLLKTKELIVFHYPNKGTLMVSPDVSSYLFTIIEEQ